ncbi:MAG: formamidopyrimidine-DNA glycosylase [Acidimicrobiales bacterium]
MLMPELPEVEAYRRLAEAMALHRVITGVEAADRWYLKGDAGVAGLEALLGHCFTRARRRGKLLLLDTDGGPTLGLRFGMTGRLVVDDVAGVDELLYSSNAPLRRFDRFAVVFQGAGRLVMRDPRRLGGVQLDPDEDRLGPDALTVTTPALRRALAGSSAPLKARLLDQHKVAGVGNLIGDEVLWRAGLDPARAAGSLDAAEIRRLSRVLRVTIAELVSRGGSHMGDLRTSRLPGGRCPLDDAELMRRTIGGRTTWSCPQHQR